MSPAFVLSCLVRASFALSLALALVLGLTGDAGALRAMIDPHALMQLSP